MIISRTPFRISLFGGGTDFPLFFREHGGAVISGTMNQYCYLSIHRLAPLFKHRYRASYSRTESVLHPREFQHPLIRETLLMFEPQEGLEIAHVADLPGRTGLGSSSSFTVGLLNALHAFHKRPTTPEELARQAIEIERERVGDAGGCRRIDFHRDGTVHSRPLPLPASRLRELEDSLMLFYMGRRPPRTRWTIRRPAFSMTRRAGRGSMRGMALGPKHLPQMPNCLLGEA